MYLWKPSDYIRKEIPYVNYVRDIKDAGVYIISTNREPVQEEVNIPIFWSGKMKMPECAIQYHLLPHLMRPRMK